MWCSADCAERLAARIAAAGVEAVLEDVEVEAAQVLGAEGLQALRDEVELEARVVGDEPPAAVSRVMARA